MLSLNRSLIGVLKYACPSDPAIDRDSPEFSPDEYSKTGDLKHLPLRSEADKLTIFHLKPLSMKRLQKITSMRALDGGGFTTEQLGEAVAYGLKCVENLELDGKLFELEFETANGEERVKNKSLEKFFRVLLFLELGSKILEISDLSF